MSTLSEWRDAAWKYTLGAAAEEFDWLKQIVFGEFDEHQTLSGQIASMLVSFLPGAVIVMSARDMVAVLLRMLKHPEKREDEHEWMLLIACAIPLVIPALAAAAGAVIAGVGALITGLVGDETAAALRVVCLLLIERSGEMLPRIVEYLRNFVHGDILAVLKEIKFAKYGDELAKFAAKFIEKIRLIIQRVRVNLLKVPGASFFEETLRRMQEVEDAFYAIQTSALKNIRAAVIALDLRLAAVLEEKMNGVGHAVRTEIPAPHPTPVTPKPTRVPTMHDNPLGTPPGTTRPGHLPPPAEPETNLHPQTAGHYLRRPYIRKAVRDEVEARALKTPDGKFIDRNTGEPIEGPYDLGHVRGHEFWREQERAEGEGLSQEEFNDRMNNPDYYQIEDPSSNRSHRFEQRGP